MRCRLITATLAMALAAGACLIPGCGLFKPRDPQPPGTISVRCLTRSAPDSVQAIVHQSYGSSSGLTCYTSTLDASFAFHPDPTDSIEDPDPLIYSNWNQSVEARVTTNLASDASPLFATFAVFDSEYAAPSIQPGPPMTETRYYAYHVLFQSKSAASPTRYQGRADITYQQGSDALWKITAWVDKRDASQYATWGRLRRDYRVGF